MGTSLTFPLIAVQLFWFGEEHRVQDLFILWFTVLTLSGWGRETVWTKCPAVLSGTWPSCGKQNERVIEKSYLSGPQPCSMGKSWSEGGVAPPWNLTGSLALLCSGSSPPWENIGLQTLQVQTSHSLQVVRRWALLPCLALTRPHLGSPGLCCTSRLYGSHSRRCGLRSFQDRVDSPYLVAIILNLAFWGSVSSSTKRV